MDVVVEGNNYAWNGIDYGVMVTFIDSIGASIGALVTVVPYHVIAAPAFPSKLHKTLGVDVVKGGGDGGHARTVADKVKFGLTALLVPYLGF